MAMEKNLRHLREAFNNAAGQRPRSGVLICFVGIRTMMIKKSAKSAVFNQRHLREALKSCWSETTQRRANMLRGDTNHDDEKICAICAIQSAKSAGSLPLQRGAFLLVGRPRSGI